MSHFLSSWNLSKRNPKIWLAGLGDDGISMSFPCGQRCDHRFLILLFVWFGLISHNMR
jgi:hypothetical protein